MFKIFNGIHLVEAYHDWKKQRRDDKIVSRMIKLAVAIAVLILLWCLPSSVYGIDGLGVIQQRVIAIFGFAILMWVFEAIPAWTTSMAVVGLLLFATSDSSFWFFEKGLNAADMATQVSYKDILHCFADPIIMLFIGGFIIAIAATKTGLDVKDESDLMARLIEMTEIEKEFQRFRTALEEVEATGYGIVMPTMKELKLEEPEIMKQGGRYGVRLKASAPSIHMMRANITTEVAPIVGTESRSEEMITYLLKEFEENPSKIWESNIFGKSLNSLVNEGLHTKLYKMPTDARIRIQETLERVINEGCSGLICIIL